LQARLEATRKWSLEPTVPDPHEPEGVALFRPGQVSQSVRDLMTVL
jgi:hypothetical protein